MAGSVLSAAIALAPKNMSETKDMARMMFWGA
jgi:hypothetical protein